MEENERSQVRPARRGSQTEPERETRTENAVGASSRIDGAIQRGRMLLDDLEAVIRDAKQLPVVKTRLIPESTFDDLMGQLRMSMPDMVREAAAILNRQNEILETARSEAKARHDEADKYDREHREAADNYDKQIRSDAENFRVQLMNRAQEEAKALVADANTRAQQIVDAANQQAAGLVEENEITRRAQAYALEIRDSANQQANAMYEQARKQTDLMLSGAAASLSRSANEMARLRDSLLSGDQQESHD